MSSPAGTPGEPRSFTENQAPASVDRVAPVSIAIAVCTHRRQEGLRALLASIARLQAPPLTRLRVVVVDNDAAGSARGALPQDFPYAITYVVEETPGIPAARTRCLALASTDDYILFVDDDETVEPEWVVEMLATLHDEHAHGVGGLVDYEYELEPPKWIARGGFFDAPSTGHREPIPFAATNNLLLHVPTLRDLGVTTFDRSMQFSGGSDVEFTSRLVQAGARLVWCAKPLVTETVPKDRVSVKWCLKRAVRTGEGVARLRAGSFSPSLRQRLGILVLGFVRMLGAVPAVGIGLVTANPTTTGRAVRGGMRGIGMSRFALGLQGAEYAGRHDTVLTP